MADDRTPDDALDTAALLDQGEQLLAESARLLRRLDAALDRRVGNDATADADADASDEYDHSAS